MDINTRQLRYFMEVASQLNFTRAALNLYVAQPTLSQQIADLEAQMGVTLFNRTSRSVTLTPAGVALYETCGDLLEHVDSVHRHVLRAESGEKGELRIGYLHEPYKRTLPAFFRQFSTQYPEISLSLTQGTVSSLSKELNKGRLDLAFIYHYPHVGVSIHDRSSSHDRTAIYDSASSYDRTAIHDGAATEPPSLLLGSEDLCLAVPYRPSYGSFSSSDYSILNNEVMFVIDDDSSPDWHTAVLETCAEIGLCPSSHVLVQKPETILMQVEAGMGITLLPESLTKSFGQNVTSIPVKKDAISRVVVWDSDFTNPSLPLFLEAVEDYLQQNRESDGAAGT